MKCARDLINLTFEFNNFINARLSDPITNHRFKIINLDQMLRTTIYKRFYITCFVCLLVYLFDTIYLIPFADFQ